MTDCTNCGHPFDWHTLNPRNDDGVCFGEGPKGHCECAEFGVTIPDTAVEVCRKALEAIAPCVVGWPEGQMPMWAEKLNAVVPELQRVLGITKSHRWDQTQPVCAFPGCTDIYNIDGTHK